MTPEVSPAAPPPANFGRTPPAPPREPQPRRSFSWLGWLAAGLVVAGLVWAKFHFFPSPAGGKEGGGKGGKGGPASAKGGPGARGGKGAKTPVGVYVVRRSELAEQVATTGSVLAEEATTVRAEIAGKLTSVNFTDGQAVRRGQLLFTINAAETEAALRRQEYNLKLYRDQEVRQRTLLAKEYISRQEYEQANNAYLTAQADLQALRATVAKAYVRAPFSGVLGLSTATVGTYVSPNTAIVALTRTRPVKIEFAVPGRYAAQVKVGDQAQLTDEATNRRLQARVYAVAPQLDPATRTLPVRARYPNAHDELKPGAFVKVNLALGAATAALQIPTEALMPQASGYQVFVVEKGKAVTRDVKIGLRSESLIQITDGLAVGDSVVRTGILQLKNGDAVRAQ